MAFIDTRFPTDISFGSAGGPEYSTDIVITQGGHEQRNVNWSSARARYNVAYGVRSQPQLDALIAFFRARKGRADSFRFKDWTDFQAEAQPIGTGDGSTTQFQLVKYYASGTMTETRTITKPVFGSVAVYLAGVLQDEADYIVSHTTGLVTFDTAPGSGVAVSADFEFDVPVRFDTDRLSASLESYGMMSVAELPLIEVRA